MISQRVMRKLRDRAWLGALALPIVCVHAARVLLDAGPSATHASPIQNPPAIAPPTPQPTRTANAATPEQRRALQWLESWKMPQHLTSPIEQPVVQNSTTPARPKPAPVTVVSTDDQQPVMVPEFDLNGVVGNGRNGLASINNRVLRPGEQAAPGWTLVDIDGSARSVTLRGPNQAEIIIAVDP